MSRYIICKSEGIRMDLMVKKEFEAQLVGYFVRTGCRYEKEVELNPGNGEAWVCLKNVQATRGADIGELIGLLYSVQWGSAGEENHDKFYIILNANKKGKKQYAHKNRKEANGRSESGNSGKTSGDIQPEQNGGSCGECVDAGNPCCDYPGEQPGLPDTIDGRCE